MANQRLMKKVAPVVLSAAVVMTSMPATAFAADFSDTEVTVAEESADIEEASAEAADTDVVEDTEITFEDLEKDFPEEVVEALRFLTRDKSMNYFDYIRNLRKNPIAKKVKQADLLHNSDVTRLTDCENISARQISRLHGRYKRALEILQETF